MKANLTKEQKKEVWNWVTQIHDEDAKVKRGLDVLGAIIHYDEYDNPNSMYGWCVEYVLSPEMLKEYDIKDGDVFCEENIRILSCKHFHLNNNHPLGEYKIFYHIVDNKYNQLRPAYQNSTITEEGIEVLKSHFGLTDEKFDKIRSDYNRTHQWNN